MLHSRQIGWFPYFICRKAFNILSFEKNSILQVKESVNISSVKKFQYLNCQTNLTKRFPYFICQKSLSKVCLYLSIFHLSTFIFCQLKCASVIFNDQVIIAGFMTDGPGEVSIFFVFIFLSVFLHVLVSVSASVFVSGFIPDWHSIVLALWHLHLVQKIVLSLQSLFYKSCKIELI